MITPEQLQSLILAKREAAKCTPRQLDVRFEIEDTIRRNIHLPEFFLHTFLEEDSKPSLEEVLESLRYLVRSGRLTETIIVLCPSGHRSWQGSSRLLAKCKERGILFCSSCGKETDGICPAFIPSLTWRRAVLK